MIYPSRGDRLVAISDNILVFSSFAGEGKKLSPAWDDFVSSQADDCGNGEYTTNTFPSLGGKGSPDAGYCHCTYTGDLPYGFDDASPFFGELDSKKRGRRARRTSEVQQHSYGNKKHASKRGTRNLSSLEDSEATHSNHISRHLEGTCPEYTMNPTASPAPTGTPVPTGAPTSGKGDKRRGRRH